MADGILPPKQTKDGSAKANKAKVHCKDNENKVSECSDKREETVHSRSKNPDEFLDSSFSMKNQSAKSIRELFDFEKSLVQEFLCDNNVMDKLLKCTHPNDSVDEKDLPRDIIKDPKDNSAISSNSGSSKENMSVGRNFIKENIEKIRDTKVKFRFGKQEELKIREKNNSMAKMQHARNDNKTQADQLKCLSKSSGILQVAKNCNAGAEVSSRSAKNTVANSFSIEMQISTPISRANVKYMSFSPMRFSNSSMSDTFGRNPEADFLIAGSKIFNALVLKAWRKRIHEIKSIKQKLNSSEVTQIETEDRLQAMTEWCAFKKERSDTLQGYVSLHLREIKYTTDEIIKNTKITRSKYENIKIQLWLKDQQCEQLNDKLTETMSKIFNTMKKRRELDKLLTTQQRSNQMMRWEKEDHTQKTQKQLDQLKLKNENLKLQIFSVEEQYASNRSHHFLQMASVDEINTENDELSASIELLEAAIDDLKYEYDELKKQSSESKIKTALKNLSKVPIGYALFTGICRLFWGTKAWSR
ncbi:uncharacterized protein LOC119661819 isoform X2 [Teleopsis dalmanni]|uniref:uncharacterized protein LOC119661819 isoform X2 n=1 Tax=Teleopsis dalmanni TaxID=139649 RepID=UPI0018CFD528|nr:uncharacterized protein LOC119661819 isoform X2 [Teleopsis dalmanni]